MNPQVIARALLQPEKNFPIDCETLDSLQANTAVVQALGNIVGDRAIIYGCRLESNNTQRSPGYVFLRTLDYPEGEVLYWAGGSVSGGMYVEKKDVAVTANGYDFPQAYTQRSLQPGIGAENYAWADFRQAKTTQQLESDVADLTAAIALLTPPPLGVVQMWAGVGFPAGYALCEGQQLAVADYPDLYAAIGNTFNKSAGSGFFNLPDLRGQFIVGQSTTDTDYATIGLFGGEKKHILLQTEMPSHSHSVDDYYFIENIKSMSKVISGSEQVDGTFTGSGETDNDNNVLAYKTHSTKNSGGAILGGGTVAHENRPPYFVLAYIMRLKN